MLFGLYLQMYKNCSLAVRITPLATSAASGVGTTLSLLGNMELFLGPSESPTGNFRA